MANKVTFDYSLTENVISADEIKSMEKITNDAKELLLSKEGAGSDFLGWIDLPIDYDKEEFARIQKAAEKIQSDSEVLLVIGIGGSYLGARAAIEFLRHGFYNNVSKEIRKTPEIYYCGNNLSGTYLSQLIDVIGDRDFSVNIISKSGTTTEPAVAFRIFKEMLEKKYGKEVYQQAMSQINGHIGDSLLNLYTVGKLSGLTEVLFIERCIRLLKPGGRLGIVLPEGVLNNTNLQTVRELFEGMAKIILITSIPQDVFMASGATVKPSLLFFKKFTNEERAQFDAIKQAATEEVDAKYQSQLDEIDSFLAERRNPAEEKKAKRAERRALETKIAAEIWAIVKEKFDYTIPIAQVEKAGITTTGAECENELIDLLKEFTPYRKEHNMWTSNELKFHYEIVDNKVVRTDQNGNTKELC